MIHYVIGKSFKPVLSTGYILGKDTTRMTGIQSHKIYLKESDAIKDAEKLRGYFHCHYQIHAFCHTNHLGLIEEV